MAADPPAAATKLELRPGFRRVVAERLREDHSPQQIAGWLRLAYPDNEAMRVSHERSTCALYVQAPGTLRRAPSPHLRTRRLKTLSPHAVVKAPGPGQDHQHGDDLRAPAGDRGARRPRPLGRRPPAREASRTRSRPWSSARRATASSSRCPTGAAAEEVRRRARPVRSPPCQSSFAARSPGTRARRCPSTGTSPSTPGSRSTSAIPEAPGNGLKREHERPPSPVLPEGREPRRGEPGAPRRGRRKAQRPPAKDARLSDPGGEAHRADRRFR